MTATLLDLLKDANLIKFFAVVGSIFFLFGVTGRVWGVKEPIRAFPKFLLFLVGALMLAGAAMGFIDNKNHYFSDKVNSRITTSTEQEKPIQPSQNNNKQKINGNNNKANGNTIGNNNQNVQGDNNNVNSNNVNIGKSSYTEGNYTVYYTYNTITGDTINQRKIKNKNPSDEDNEANNSPCSLNNKTYYMMTMRPHYYIKFYDKSGNAFKFIAHVNAYQYNGTAIQTGTTITFKGNNDFGDGEASLSNSCKYLTGFIEEHSLNMSL